VRRLWVLVGLGAVLLAAVLAWFLWPDEPAAPDSTGEVEEPDPEEDFGLFVWESDPGADVAPGPEPGAGPPGRPGWGPPGGDPEAWRQRREEMRRRFEAMSPEERRRILSQRIRITSLGDAPADLEPEQVMDSMGAVREQVRQCVQDNGGFMALRSAMQQARADAGIGRRGLTVSFDVAADGSLAQGSLQLSPAPPEPFYGCFTGALRSVELPPPGDDGARVEVRLGPPPGRGGPPWRRDGGWRGPPRDPAPEAPATR